MTYEVQPAELAALGRDLAAAAGDVACAVDRFDRGHSVTGAELGHPLATAAYDSYFGAWSLRLHSVVAALDDTAAAVTTTGQLYAQWDHYVAGLVG